MLSDKREIQISEMYPDFSAHEQTEAATSLAQYIELLCRIYERNKNLTEMDHPGTI